MSFPSTQRTCTNCANYRANEREGVYGDGPFDCERQCLECGKIEPCRYHAHGLSGMGESYESFLRGGAGYDGAWTVFRRVLNTAAEEVTCAN